MFERLYGAKRCRLAAGTPAQSVQDDLDPAGNTEFLENAHDWVIPKARVEPDELCKSLQRKGPGPHHFAGESGRILEFGLFSRGSPTLNGAATRCKVVPVVTVVNVPSTPLQPHQRVKELIHVGGKCF